MKFTAQQNEVNGFLLFRMLLGVRVTVKFESHLHIGLLLMNFSIHWDECGDVGVPLVRNGCRIQIIVQSDSSITGGGQSWLNKCP